MSNELKAESLFEQSMKTVLDQDRQARISQEIYVLKQVINDLANLTNKNSKSLEETINSLTDNLVKNVKKYSERIEELNKEYKW
jgi:ABC-type transporter Mla subunit MlaD|tara:strand:- start:641 stop:892 length:252 start_codon:yes stop_codon:yes gene_type:complete